MDKIESFIVKNLENIQGDERDVIIVSTTYGPDPETGRVYQRFGPINSEFGWRRLNVLFTRAKKRIEIYSSLQTSDIQADEISSRGVIALRNYINFAANGRLEGGTVTGRETDSDFETMVMERLEADGFEVVPQVGVDGFFIDLAVSHPSYPHGYLLGIECDGATYHSSKSARDRDRLRQEILENLGWRIYRIWSTDWFQNSEQEYQRLKRHVSRLLQEHTNEREGIGEVA
jgi:very-short-patch-repair endonuclease